MSEFPEYSYVPGLWPHPHSDAAGHRFAPVLPAPDLDNLAGDATFGLAIQLFDAGYYWEAHELWETIWHAAGRRGPIADLCKALIQLAVAGVKVREGRPDGVKTHAARAAELFDSLGRTGLGDLAREIAASPPKPPEKRLPVERVFPWNLADLHAAGSDVPPSPQGERGAHRCPRQF